MHFAIYILYCDLGFLFIYLLEKGTYENLKIIEYQVSK